MRSCTQVRYYKRFLGSSGVPLLKLGEAGAQEPSYVPEDITTKTHQPCCLSLPVRYSKVFTRRAGDLPQHSQGTAFRADTKGMTRAQRHRASPWSMIKLCLQGVRSKAVSPLSNSLEGSFPQHPPPHPILSGFPSPRCTFQIINGLLQLRYRPLSKFSTGLCLQKEASPVVQQLWGTATGYRGISLRT